TGCARRSNGPSMCSANRRLFMSPTPGHRRQIRRRRDILPGMRLVRVTLGVLLFGASAPAYAGFDWQGAVDVDAEGLQQTDNPKARLDAVAFLSQRDINLAQPYLMKALSDEDISVRHQAAKALGAGQ